MKKVILGLLLVTNILMGKDTLFYGAYYGDNKSTMSSWANYPNNNISTIGKLYLYKNKIETVNFIADKKSEHISNAIQEAKQYAKKNKYSKCAIDNIKHQVIMGENEIAVMTDYNVIAFE